MTGTTKEEVYSAVSLLLKDKEAHSAMSQAQNPYGDGTASAQIISFVKNAFAHKTSRSIDTSDEPLGDDWIILNCQSQARGPFPPRFWCC